MTCTSVITCLSNGLAKNDKSMFMFVLFSWLLNSLKVNVWPFFLKWGTDFTPKQSNRMF